MIKIVEEPFDVHIGHPVGSPTTLPSHPSRPATSSVHRGHASIKHPRRPTHANAADTARLKAVTDTFDGAVRVECIARTISKKALTSGDDKIENPYSSLFSSLGFNVANSSGATYVITAAHCVKATQYWFLSSSGNSLGHRVGFSYPDNDYGVVKHDNGAIIPYGTVNNDGRVASGTGTPTRFR